MSTKVLVIGFDALEVTLVERWVAEGKLPHFAALRARSRAFRLGNPMETLPGAIWPEINTGVSSAKMGHFYTPDQLRTGEARLRATRPDEIDPELYYWTQASRAGRRVAVIDSVQAIPARDINGIQLFEWGLHDRDFGVSSDPPELLDEIRARYGDHPITSCDAHGEKLTGYRRLLEGLLYGVKAKAEFVPALLRREDWDLFACTISESHCVGHQFWHFLDAQHPWHGRRAQDDIRNALFTVYAAIDDALRQVLVAAGPDAAVLAVFSHGMGLYYDGPQLLPEVLARLGMASGSMAGFGAGLRQLKTKLTYLPRPVKALIKPIARWNAVRAPIAAAGALVDPFTSPKTRAAAVSNNRCGAIRLNVRGREPHGSVAPGAEADALLSLLKRELLALRDPASGETIVARVFTANDKFGQDHHPDLPDLICVFRTDLGMIEHCESPAVGRVYVPVYHPHAPRTGDHSVNSRLWFCGPDVEADGAMYEGNVLDIAPTVLRLLDVELPAWLDGESLVTAHDAAHRVAGQATVATPAAAARA